MYISQALKLPRLLLQVAKSTVPHSSRCPEDTNVAQFKPTHLAPLSPPTLTHLTEPAHPGATLGVGHNVPGNHHHFQMWLHRC